MSLVDALLMSSAVKDKARNLVSTVPYYVTGIVQEQETNFLSLEIPTS